MPGHPDHSASSHVQRAPADEAAGRRTASRSGSGAGHNCATEPGAESAVSKTYVDLGPSAHGLWYEPDASTTERERAASASAGGRSIRGADRSRVAFVNVHPWIDSTDHWMNAGLARHGYRVLAADQPSTWMGVPAVSGGGVHLHDTLPTVGRAVTEAHSRPEVEATVLLGHSAGAQLVGLYQNVAENGVGVGQGSEKLLPLPDSLRDDPLPPADGVFIMDGHLGDGAKGLTDLGPQIVDPADPQRRDPDLDMLDTANGYVPDPGEPSSYTDAFLDRFFRAQADRMRTLLEENLETLEAVRSGAARFPDDEGFLFLDARSRVWRPDPSILAHTRGEWTLVRAGDENGAEPRETVQQVHSVREAKEPDYEPPMRYAGAEVEPTTVRRFLSTRAVRPTDDYRLTASSIEGIDWQSSNATTPGNLETVSAPLLILQMTGHYFVVQGEVFRSHAGGSDATLKYVHGADHYGNPIDPQYGDTRAALVDAVDRWTVDRYVS